MKANEPSPWTHTIGGNPEPRMWLMTPEKNLLLSWAIIQKNRGCGRFSVDPFPLRIRGSYLVFAEIVAGIVRFDAGRACFQY